MLCLSDSQPEFCPPEKCSRTYPSRTSFCPAFCESEKYSWTYSDSPLVGAPTFTRKMFLNLSPASTSVFEALNRPGKYSWTYHAVALPPPPNCPNPKNVPGHI